MRKNLQRPIVHLIMNLNRCNSSVAKLKSSFCCIKSPLIPWTNELFLHCSYSERFFICVAKFEKLWCQLLNNLSALLIFGRNFRAWRQSGSSQAGHVFIQASTGKQTRWWWGQCLVGCWCARSVPLVYWQSGNLIDFSRTLSSWQLTKLAVIIFHYLSKRATHLALNTIYNVLQQFFCA